MRNNAKRKLINIAEIEGFKDTHDLIEAYYTDSAVPGICMNPDCDYTVEVEPDQTQGFCEKCGTKTVVSALVLAGVV